MKMKTRLKTSMMHEFEILELENLSYFVRMEFMSTRNEIFFHQEKCAEDNLKRFKMRNCNPSITLMEIGINHINDEFVDATPYK